MELYHKVYENEKNKNTLFILHGLLGSADNWHTYSRKMSQYLRVVTIDQRNHGKSPRTETMSYPEMASDLKELVEKFSNAPEIYIMGHSMGGKTAMTFAQLFPELLQKLIVVDISPAGHQIGYHQIIFNALKQVPLESIQRRSEADVFLRKYIESFAIRQFLLKGLFWNSEIKKFQWRFNLPVLEKEYQKILAEVPFVHPFEKPALFVKGNRSDYITKTHIPLIMKYFPTAKIVGIEGAGHWVHAEAFQEFFKITYEFLFLEQE